MTLYEIIALLRRHILAVAVVVLLASVAGHDILTTPPVYSESGSVVFTLTRRLLGLAAASDQRALIGQSLIATEATMVEAVSSPPAAAGVRAAGGTAHFTVTPFNSHNLEYPDYAVPSATLVVSSPSPSATQRTFDLVVRMITHRLAVAQERAGAAAGNRIRVYVAADTGLQRSSGSPVRIMCGMGLLTTVAVLTVTGLLDRRRRPPGRRRAGHGWAGDRGP
jgi:hypothetical protein